MINIWVHAVRNGCDDQDDDNGNMWGHKHKESDCHVLRCHGQSSGIRHRHQHHLPDNNHHPHHHHTYCEPYQNVIFCRASFYFGYSPSIGDRSQSKLYKPCLLKLHSNVELWTGPVISFKFTYEEWQQQIYKKCPITASTQCFPLETFYWGISFHISPPLCTLLAIISQKYLKQASWRTLLSPAGTVSCIVDLWSQKFDAFMSFMWDPIVLLRLSSELAMKMEERERLSLRSSMIKVSFVLFVF